MESFTDAMACAIRHMPLDPARRNVLVTPLLREEAADMGGLQEWQQPEVHRAAVILQGHRRL